MSDGFDFDDLGPHGVVLLRDVSDCDSAELCMRLHLPDGRFEAHTVHIDLRGERGKEDGGVTWPDE